MPEDSVTPDEGPSPNEPLSPTQRLSPNEPLSLTERSELERLRTQSAARGHGWARAGRWTAACAVLALAAVLGSFAVVAVYLRAEVLDTDTYVETVAPLGTDPTVRTAVANRLTDEIVTRTDLEGLAKELADKLVTEGAPARITDLVGPLVGGITSFVSSKINQLMATQRFEVAWQNINRVGHEGLVTALLGGQGKIVTSENNTVTVDLGELLTLAKQQLVADGFTIVAKIPDVSIPYTLVESNQLPKIRTYTKLLNTVGTWLPWVALLAFVAGVLIAPNRRRGVLLGAVFLGIMAVVVLTAVTVARTYYVDNLPASVNSPDAAAVVLSTVLRFLVAELQTLIVAMAMLVLGAFLVGPSVVAVAIRRVLNIGFDWLAMMLRRTGEWAIATGRVIGKVWPALRIAIVLLAVVLLIAANRPGIPTLLWTALGVLVLLAILEVFVRTAPRRTRVGGPTPA